MVRLRKKKDKKEKCNKIFADIFLLFNFLILLIFMNKLKHLPRIRTTEIYPQFNK